MWRGPGPPRDSRLLAAEPGFESLVWHVVDLERDAKGAIALRRSSRASNGKRACPLVLGIVAAITQPPNARADAGNDKDSHDTDRRDDDLCSAKIQSCANWGFLGERPPL
jgi:hypothetical protein